MSRVFDPLRLSAVSLDVMAVNRGTPADVEARQRRRLQRVVEAALRGSRLYRQLFPAGATSATPLQSLPPVTRASLMERFDDWVTDLALRREGLLEFIADPARIAEPWQGRYMVWESSGTSGQPGIFVQDAQAMAVYDALEALRRSPPRLLARWMDPLYLGERMAFVGATGGHYASFVSLQRLCTLNPWLRGAMRSFSIQQSTPALVEALNAFAPTVIATYPTVATLLADEAARGTLRIVPHEIWTGGETLGPAARRHIEMQLGGTVRNSYGASEFLAMGWECAHGRMHLNADWVVLEPVDERYRPVPPGQPACSVLLTNLANTVQPLIRYDLGDQVAVHDERCSCGSPLPVIEVQGRRDDPLVMAGRDGRPVTLLPLALTSVIEEEAGVFDFQLRQLDDHTLVLRLAIAEGEAVSALARCRQALKAFADAQGLKPIRVLKELSPATPRRRSGKACRVVARAP